MLFQVLQLSVRKLILEKSSYCKQSRNLKELFEKWIKRVYEYKWDLLLFNKLRLPPGFSFVRKCVVTGGGHGSLNKFFESKRSICWFYNVEIRCFSLTKQLVFQNLIMFNYKVKNSVNKHNWNMVSVQKF